MSAAGHGKAVVVLGAGNIGSQLVPHLGRMPGVERVVLIDHQSYASENVVSQNISADDVGRTKVAVQAERLLGINPSLMVEPMARALEEVPLGRLRADVLACCLDSRSGRQYVNEAAVHLGLPWIDSGIAMVPGGSKLARVTVYPPGDALACMECAWGPHDQQLNESYPCQGGPAETPSTGAPAYLGALAASLQAFACESVLAGDVPAGARQVIMDAHFNTILETTYQRNPDCLLADHGAWTVTPLGRSAGEVTVEELFALAAGAAPNADQALGVEWGRLELGAQCGQCGFKASGLRLRRLAPADWGRCPKCPGHLIAVGVDAVEHATLGALTETARSRSLRSVGIEAGDILRITGPHGVSRFEVDAERETLAGAESMPRFLDDSDREERPPGTPSRRFRSPRARRA